MIDSWKKLTITAEAELLEIISADIIHISNGIIEKVNNHIHFIEYDDIPLIKKKILKYKNKKVQFEFKEQIKLLLQRMYQIHILALTAVILKTLRFMLMEISSFTQIMMFV